MNVANRAATELNVTREIIMQNKNYNSNNRPQYPIKPYPYIEEEIEYKNIKDNVTLSATLTTPYGNGQYPAVILIAGGGPVDRNGYTPGVEHQTFLVLADYLTRHGIAVLRVDKRGIGKSTGDWNSSTTLDFAYDVLDGINELKKRKYINPKKIGLIGHSEGGIIASMTSCLSDDISFIAFMACPGLTGEETLLLQIPLILNAEGISAEEVDAQLKATQAIIKLVRTKISESKLKEEIEKIYSVFLKDSSSQMFTKQLYEGFYSTPWFKGYIDFEPKEYLIKTKCPILAVNGTKDLQVPANENLKAIEETLIKGENNNFKIVKLEGVSHFFQTAITGFPMEYAKIEETLSPKFLKILTNWILEQTVK